MKARTLAFATTLTALFAAGCNAQDTAPPQSADQIRFMNVVHKAADAAVSNTRAEELKASCARLGAILAPIFNYPDLEGSVKVFYREPGALRGAPDEDGSCRILQLHHRDNDTAPHTIDMVNAFSVDAMTKEDNMRELVEDLFHNTLQADYERLAKHMQLAP